MYFITFVVFFKIIIYLKLFELNKKNIILYCTQNLGYRLKVQLFVNKSIKKNIGIIAM